MQKCQLQTLKALQALSFPTCALSSSSLAYGLLIICHIFGEGGGKSNINRDRKRKIKVIIAQAFINFRQFTYISIDSYKTTHQGSYDLFFLPMRKQTTGK